ncbi:hypothetical protein INT44_003472 [Umbelopsis vinacea]|uniref:Sister chromatid cohesion protein DCC1 n=1 Tax=Umbelopsis vinacea TaxID=44442 RepID=A0A8H7PUI4_9FUNG|nr:hypothetical protein INT44_003472 [Umbelopsis vinacea]
MTSKHSALRFSNDYELNSLKLLELPPDLLEELTTNSSPLYIKGATDEEAVLCTKKKTYSVRQVNLSNSLLLASNSQDGILPVYNIKDTQFSTIELLPCLPRIEKLDTILNPTMYTGPENEGTIQSKGQLYTYDNLLSLIQASEQELQQELKRRHVVVIDGYYRLIHPRYLHRIIDAVITSAEIHDMELTRISVDQCRQYLMEEFELNMLDEDVLTKCLETASDEQTAADGTYCFNETKLCRLLGERLLVAERGKQWQLDEFLELWQKRTPHPFEAKLEMLRGLYIKTPKSRSSGESLSNWLISYFPLSELPADPAGRFSHLFLEQKQWVPEDILPFIEDLAPDKKKLDALLLKFTRSQKLDGRVVYGSRIK